MTHPHPPGPPAPPAASSPVKARSPLPPPVVEVSVADRIAAAVLGHPLVVGLDTTGATSRIR